MSGSKHIADQDEVEWFPEETELWEAIQQAKDDQFVRPDQDFEF